MSEVIKEKRIKRKKKWSTKKKLIVAGVSIIAIIAILASTFLFGYYHIKNKIYTETKPSNVNKNENVKYAQVEGVTNVLLIGTDGRTLDEPSRSDSIIIATLDNNNKKVKLTSLFRDTLVDIPGYGESKINGAFLQGGPELLMETVQDTYDIKIDKYIIINFWGFEAIIDQIGGLELDVKDYQLEELNKYIGEATGGNDCPVEETGLQLLNGKQALSYARIRYNVGDEYERTERQREVLFKVAEKLKVTSPTKYLGIMNKMLDYINTNIDPLEALNMAYTIYKFPKLETEQLQMPITELAEGRLYKNLGWVFLMDKEQNSKLLKQFIFQDTLPDPELYDYNSLDEKLLAYASDEAYYNNKYGINPEEYNSSDEETKFIPEKENTPVDNEPNAPVDDEPNAPVDDEPSTPVDDEPNTPVDDEPNTPVDNETPEVPETPDKQEDGQAQETENKPTDQQKQNTGTSSGDSGQSGTLTGQTNP